MDPALSGLAVRIGMRIVTKYLQSDPEHPDRGWAWPSQERLAGDLGASVEGVRKALFQLRGKHLYVREGSGCGRGNSIRYAPRLISTREVPDTRAALVDEIPQLAMEVSDDIPRTPVGPLGEQELPIAIAETPNFGPEKPPTPVGTNPSYDSYPGSLGSARANEGPPKVHRFAELPISSPTEPDILWARSRTAQVGARIDLDAEADRFRDYHLSKGSRYADWSARWRTWIGKAIDFAQERQSRAPASGAQDRKSALAWAMEGHR